MSEPQWLRVRDKDRRRCSHIVAYIPYFTQDIDVSSCMAYRLSHSRAFYAREQPARPEAGSENAPQRGYPS